MAITNIIRKSKLELCNILLCETSWTFLTKTSFVVVSLRRTEQWWTNDDENEQSKHAKSTNLCDRDSQQKIFKVNWILLQICISRNIWGFYINRQNITICTLNLQEKQIFTVKKEEQNLVYSSSDQFFQSKD